MKTRRGADVGSDHFLVVGKIRLKISKVQRQFGRKKYNIQKLKEDETQQMFNIEVRNRFQVLDIAGEEVEDLWQKTKKVYSECAGKVLGYQKREHKEWISETTWQRIEERTNIKKRILTETNVNKLEQLKEDYRNKNREVKRNARRDKRKFHEDLATEAEEAANTLDLKTLYNITKKLGYKQFRTAKPIKDKEGKTLVTEAEQIKRWREFITETFNEIIEEQEITDNKREKLKVNENKITKQEIKDALKKLKNGKAAGEDNIPGELLKSDINQTTDVLYILLNKIWETGTIPKDWKCGVLIKLPKKGDLSNCNNWRGITLLNVTSKILTRIILERLKKPLDEILRENQAGFRAKRSCSDHIVTLRNIIEQTLEFNNNLHLVFVDFEKAFDSLNRRALWKILEYYGIPEKFIAIIKQLYEDYAVKIEHGGALSEPVPITSGVRQGCIISPTLFLIALDWVMRRIPQRLGIPWKVFDHLEDLDFADDICLLSNTKEQMQRKVEALEQIGKIVGLKINQQKTKLLSINCTNNTAITVNQQPIEQVNKFTYLGSVIDEKGGTEEDVKNRIQKAQITFTTLNKVWRSNEISQQTKIRLFNSNVKSILLYGAESWKTNQSVIKKLQVFTNKCLRKILRIYWPKVISNKELWEISKQRSIRAEIMSRKWRWIGHTLRKGDTDITKEALEWNPQGKRKRGRPCNTWRRSVISEAKQMGKTWTELKSEAKNRIRWKSTVSALCSKLDDAG